MTAHTPTAPTTNSTSPAGHVGTAPRGHVEHRDEDAEIQQRRSEVVEQSEDGQAGAHDHQHRAEHGDGRDRDAQEAPCRDREQLAFVAQVAGQEDHQSTLVSSLGWMVWPPGSRIHSFAPEMSVPKTTVARSKATAVTPNMYRYCSRM